MEYYISHHGIEGQKWGVQNGPPYPLNPEDHSKAEKRAATKYLNKLDKTTAWEKRYYSEKEGTAYSLDKKIKKLSKKEQTDKVKNKINTLKEKSKTAHNEANIHLKNIQSQNKKAQQYVRELEKKGYTVKQVATQRSVVKGSEFAAVLGGVVLQTAAASVGIPSMVIYNIPQVQGTKYKVK